MASPSLKSWLRHCVKIYNLTLNRYQLRKMQLQGLQLGTYTEDLFALLLKVTGEFSGNNIGGARYRLLKGRHPNKIRPEKSSYV